jgi:hypothetical protein
MAQVSHLHRLKYLQPFDYKERPVVIRPPAAMAHNAVYFDFDYFMSSALEDATDNAKKLASSLREQNSLSNLLSHVSDVFLTIIKLIQMMGLVATLGVIAILVAVPMVFLSTALGVFFAGNPAFTFTCVAVLGVGFIATIRKLGQERDILVAFQHEAKEFSTKYSLVRFRDRNEFSLATQQVRAMALPQMLVELTICHRSFSLGVRR